jgi:APA family basic amino acid/polyamine antiporter
LQDAPSQRAPQKRLTLFDSTCLIVGIIVGAGIYQMAPNIAKGAHDGWGVLLIWIAGGLISLCGALGYAELASAYPQAGGDYVYLSRAYGGWAGFLFGWLQLAVVRPGDIVVMAFAFATYARALGDPLSGAGWPYSQQLYASGAVVCLTVINCLGVRQGKWTQNLLTLVKALGLLAIVGVALGSPGDGQSTPTFETIPTSVAVILVLFTFGGWNEVAYVAAELHAPRRNILRALILGIAAVTCLYVMVNVAFLHALGYTGLAASDQVATDAVSAVFPRWGSRLISALVCISALGAVNGLIFTGARISYAVGADHRAFGLLGTWSAKTGTPIRALVLQGLLALTLIILLKDFVETVLYTAPAVYLFYMATSLAVVVLRRREPGVDRPYRVTGYPFTTLVFVAACGFLIYSGITYAIYVKEKPWIVLVPFAVMLAGIPLYILSRVLPARRN